MRVNDRLRVSILLPGRGGRAFWSIRRKRLTPARGWVNIHRVRVKQHLTAIRVAPFLNGGRQARELSVSGTGLPWRLGQGFLPNVERPI